MPRLYKPRLFELIDGDELRSPIELTNDEFSTKIRHFLVRNQSIVSGEPRYLFIKVNTKQMLELTGLYTDTQYVMRSNWTELRSWDDFIRFLQAKWAL
jgi:hypothetical protein